MVDKADTRVLCVLASMHECMSVNRSQHGFAFEALW